MSLTDFSHVINHTRALQLAGSKGSENSFDIAGSPFALGAKATPAPKNTRTNNPFGPIIRRIYILMLHKGPQMLSNFIILSFSLSFSFSLKNREREKERERERERDDLSVISL